MQVPKPLLFLIEAAFLESNLHAVQTQMGMKRWTLASSSTPCSA